MACTIKGFLSCLWGVLIPGEASWLMRKLLKLRDLCKDWIRYVIGDGNDTFLWKDNWHPLGALYQRFGELLVRDRDQALKAKVASIIDQGSWSWPNQRNMVMQIIWHTPDKFLSSPSNCDRVVWTLAADGVFSVKSAWEACRHRNPIQNWHKLVWFSQGVPRWSFIAWLAIWGRLSPGIDC